jgi:hypothetical protein
MTFFYKPLPPFRIRPLRARPCATRPAAAAPKNSKFGRHDATRAGSFNQASRICPSQRLFRTCPIHCDFLDQPTYLTVYVLIPENTLQPLLLVTRPLPTLSHLVKIHRRQDELES